jgi:tetratricopeptide (TPR) repeat protein
LAASILIILILNANVAYASFLSEITGIDINVPAGTISFHAPHPEVIPEMLRNLPQDIMYFLSPAAQQLAFLIRQAQAQASPGSQPIPPLIRERLKWFFPAYILDKARWNIYDAGRHTLDSVILGTDCSALNLPWNIDCKMGAITLDQTIVFRGQFQAENNWVSWAHELVHVSQYDSMGVDGFAYVYASPGAISLESQAYRWENTVQNTPVVLQPTMQARWTAAPGPRVTLTAANFQQAIAKVTSDPQWRKLHTVWGQGQDCASIGPGTDTGIMASEAAAHYSRGQAFEQAGKWTEAVAEYREATRLDFTKPLAFERLGIALTRIGQSSEAAKQFKRAVCLDQSNDMFRRDLTSALAKNGDALQAIVEYQHALYANPNSVTLHRDLAAVYRSQGDEESAQAEEFAVVALTPPDGGPAYARLRQHLLSDWSVTWAQTHADGYYRTHWTLGRLDDCVLSWTENREATHSGQWTVEVHGITIHLDQIKAENLKVINISPTGWTLAFDDPQKRAITTSLGAQLPSGRMLLPTISKPSSAWLSGLWTSEEANQMLQIMRGVVGGCTAR